MLVERTVALRNAQPDHERARQRGTDAAWSACMLLIAGHAVRAWPARARRTSSGCWRRTSQFRENAASAASAGIEFAISRIVTTSVPRSTTPVRELGASAGLDGSLRNGHAFRRLRNGAAADARCASSRARISKSSARAFAAAAPIDRQRARCHAVVVAASGQRARTASPSFAVRCAVERGELVRLSWQRLASE